MPTLPHACDAHRARLGVRVKAEACEIERAALTAERTGQEVGVGLLSRWPIERTEVHRLPSSHRDEVVVLAAAIRHPLGPLHAIVPCADYAEDAAAERLAQVSAVADLATDRARDGRLPVLAMGDLNAPPESPEIRALAARPTDAWVAANGADAPGITIGSTDRQSASQLHPQVLSPLDIAGERWMVP